MGELIFDLFLTSSNNLTATVESNAATEKKKLYRTGSALDGLASGEVSSACDFIASCYWSLWSPKVGTDSSEQCQSVVGHLHRCDCCTLS